MRTTRSGRALGTLLFVAWGCGGNVVVDGSPAGSGGSTSGTGGAGTSSSSGAQSSSATSSGTGGGFTCDFACGGPIGLCACAGPCSDGQTRAVGCGGGTAGGFACACVVNDQAVGTCDSPSLACGLPASCCAGIFGL